MCIRDSNTAKRYWESIKASVQTSFYTDTRIVSAIADALSATDVQVRRCLDPSMGMGAQLLKLKRKRLPQQSILPEQPILLLTRFVIAFHEALTRFMDELQIQAFFPNTTLFFLLSLLLRYLLIGNIGQREILG